MISSTINTLRFVLLCAILAGAVGAQTLSMVSGNGQMVSEQFVSNAPLVVQAKDAAGRPAAGVAVNWSITQGVGTLNGAMNVTDSNGQASTKFLATTLQPGTSFQAQTITATSGSSSVNFVITTALSRTPAGIQVAPPVVVLVQPTSDNLSISARSGSTLPGGVVVRVVAQGGTQVGAPVPNIGVRIVNADLTTATNAACNAPLGLVLTDSTGTATCDLVISGPPGAYQLRAYGGESQSTTSFSLEVTPGAACTYSLSASSQNFSSSGGTGIVNVLTSAGCGWSASSSAGYVTITAGSSGTGNGSVSYLVAPNSGPARAATMTIAGQTYTVNQSGASTPGALTILTQTLPAGTVNVSYSAALTASGGQSPYTWSITSGVLPTGLTLAASGAISGTPSAAGSAQFTATVRDSAGATQSQNLSISIGNTAPSGFTITNASFPNGVIGQSYSQLLTALGGCVTPFAPQPAFTVSNGSLPNGLSIQVNSDGSRSIAGTPTTAGASSFTLSATDACGKSATASFTIPITGTPASQQMLVSPASLAFTVQLGSSNAPADQTVAITSNSGALSYSASVVVTTGGNWLVAKSPTSGTTPGSFTAGATNFATLAPGTYSGSISLASQASNSPVVVPASLTVLAAPALTISPNSFVVNQAASTTPQTSRQTFNVASGTASMQFTASAATNKGGHWLDVSTTQGSTPATLTAIISSGGLAAGQYTGVITITPASGAPQTVTITLNVLTPATLSAAPAPLTFSYQLGTATPASQTVAVNSTGSPLNIAVVAATQNGGTWLSAGPAGGVTTVNLSVTANPAGLSPGSYSGTITITPTDPMVTPLTIPVTLVITPAAPAITSITNAASYAPGPIAPGELVTIFGTAMGPSILANLRLTESGRVDTSVAGTQVFFDGFAAPIVYTSAGAVSVIVPFEVAGTRTTSVFVQFQSIRSNTLTIPVIDSVPGIFTIDATGFGQGAILNQDSSVNSEKNGADPGSVIVIYATGAGQTDPGGVDGAITSEVLAVPRAKVTVQIGGEPAEVIYAGSAPLEPAGMLQVNAKVPADVPRGKSIPVVVTVGAASSQAGVTVAIRP